MMLCVFNCSQQFKSRHVRTRSDGHLAVHQTEHNHRFKTTRSCVLEHIDDVLSIQIDFVRDHSENRGCDRCGAHQKLSLVVLDRHVGGELNRSILMQRMCEYELITVR